MKKSLLAISLISSFAFAEFDTKAVVGASAAKIDNENYTQYNVGYTSQTRFDNQIILGFGNTLSYGNVNKGKELIGLDMDLKAGYEVYKNLTAFAIGTGVVQSVDNNSSWGLGYGGALEYKLTSNVALEGSYKTINMNDSNGDYDYKTTNIGVKFNY
jgi:opacity protein-like surface antigen